MKNTVTYIEEQKDTARLETFSDGVFCIAITLLTLEISVAFRQHISNGELMHELFLQWPICVAYMISFVNVLLAWMGHHSLFKYLHRSNNAVMICNGLLLMLVALVPFPTKILGLFFQTGAVKVAVIFYAAYFVLISLAFRLLWFAASRKSYLLVNSITEQEIKKITRNENLGLIFNAIILAVAFLNPFLALGLSFVMWIYWIVF
ncbi:MAG: TMEM175 family protein [Ferruginibacter sp.]